ncbi:hypothetical protein D0Y65_046557 [Glycine soja]|uniref:Uncharacterized protein n=1 Tax=Glycine soja TaxID=3848 RepID=A0A445G9T0_GLYSO|nr:hypothetical protein D0Y65_046557 [Glycine soja]
MLQPYGISIGLKEYSNPVTPKAYTPKSPSGPLPPDSEKKMSRCSTRTTYVGNLPGDIREREVEDLFLKVL